MNALPLILTVFVACVVEAVEALTIVLAAVTAAIGPAISVLPLTGLRLVVGALLAIFGLQWLRKAVLRATGFKALHDEASAYLREVAAAKDAVTKPRRGVRDWYSFTLAFKGVLLEGLEVVFIVITFGDNQKDVGAAVIGAAAAIAVVTLTGIAVKAPLTRVPENWMKLAVGVMLTSFGTFWGAEGAGVNWPGGDAALLVLVPVIAVTAAACIYWLRGRGATLRAATATGASEVITR